MSTNESQRRHYGRPLIEEHLRATFLPDLRANDTEFPDNPTGVDKPFWKYMVSHPGLEAYDARKSFGIDPDPERWGKEPIFCFNRFGQTETKLPDGRVVYIGGEHEDYYDPDFFIYNDVVVVQPDGGDAGEDAGETDDDADAHSYSGAELELWDYRIVLREEETAVAPKTAASADDGKPANIEIYGYPTDVFPGTEFHTATYVKDEESTGEKKEYIYIIGGLGYSKSPHRQTTLTHRLDLQDYSIQRIETKGEAPPPRDSASEKRKAELQGGRIVYTVGKDEYVLSLTDMRWAKA
jgi:hypothetical protein